MARHQNTTVERDVSAEIARQISELERKRDQIVAERAAFFAQNSFGPPAAEVAITERDRAVRERARALLNGHGTAISAAPASNNADENLSREQQAAAASLGISRWRQTRFSARA
jgi:hypothetical protein